MSVDNVEFLLHNDPSFAAWNGFLFDRIVDVRLEGTRIGDLPPDLRLPSTMSPLERQQKIVEAIAIANVLVACGQKRFKYSPARTARCGSNTARRQDRSC